MPHVLHVLTVPDSLVFLTGQLGDLRTRGYDFTVVTSPGPALDAFGEREDIRTIGITMPRRITPLADARAVARLTAVIRDVKPDLVHGHTPKGGLLAMLAARAAGIDARVYHMRGLPSQTARGAMRVALTGAERLTCALARTVVCVSPSLRAVAVAEGLVPAAKAEVIGHGSGNGVDADGRFDPERSRGAREDVRARHGIPPAALVLGFVGRLVRDKGVVELDAAWRRLRERDPSTHLLIVGDFEPRDAVPAATRAALEADPRVHIVGHQADMPRYYAAMDLVVLPTWREGFPNVLLEAGAMGLPVVASAVTGCVDAVVPGVTGQLVPVRDVDALAAAISAYAGNAALRRTHGDAARARARRDFPPAAIWQGIDAVYRRLLAPAGAGAPVA